MDTPTLRQDAARNGAGEAADAGWAAVRDALPEGARLTVGIIARNGLPFLHDCLGSLPPAGSLAGVLDIILVDSASDDGTTEAMMTFAAGRPDARVFRVDGLANAAVARNVILDQAGPGFLMMLDGDMVLSPAFIETAVRRIAVGEAEAVVGSLREQRFDAANLPDGDPIWRHPPVGPDYVRLTGGAIFLGPEARDGRLRYDEGQRMCEDWDFALRLSRRGRILRIPDIMALHLTHYYFSPHRHLDYYRDMRPRNFGLLVRKHMAHPARLAAVFNRERGIAAGGILQLLAIVGLLSGTTWLLALALAALAADGVRSVLRGKGPEWAGTRLAAPWIVAYGLVRPPPPDVRYDVRQIA